MMSFVHPPDPAKYGLHDFGIVIYLFLSCFGGRGRGGKVRNRTRRAEQRTSLLRRVRLHVG